MDNWQCSQHGYYHRRSSTSFDSVDLVTDYQILAVLLSCDVFPWSSKRFSSALSVWTQILQNLVNGISLFYICFWYIAYFKPSICLFLFSLWRVWNCRSTPCLLQALGKKMQYSALRIPFNSLSVNPLHSDWSHLCLTLKWPHIVA